MAAAAIETAAGAAAGEARAGQAGRAGISAPAAAPAAASAAASACQEAAAMAPAASAAVVPAAASASTCQEAAATVELTSGTEREDRKGAAVPTGRLSKPAVSATAAAEREALTILRRLVQARSENPPGSTRACAAVITTVLEAEGIPYELYEPRPDIISIVARLIGTRSDAGTPRTLLLNGHIDTIPAGTGWTVNPFAAEIRDGYLYGRGATDMKAGIAASLAAFIELNRRGRSFNGEIIFTAVGDEEYHSEFGTKWLLQQGLTADAAINCEPTNLEVCLGNRGLLMVDVLVKGRSSHGGRPNLGKNAVSIAAEIIRALEAVDIEAGRDDNFKDPLGSLSIVGMHGGDRINVIPDRCIFYIDRRLTTKESSEFAVRQIEDVIRRTTGIQPSRDRASEAEIIIHPEVWHEPFWMDLDDPFVSECIGYYVEHFGRKPVIEGKSAGTDASHLVTIGKIPTIIFGPGDYRESHTVDEKVALSQVYAAVDFYLGLLERLML